MELFSYESLLFGVNNQLFEKNSEKNREKLVGSWLYRDIISQLIGLVTRDIIVDIVAI